MQLAFISYSKGTDSNKKSFSLKTFHTDCFMESLSNKTKLNTLLIVEVKNQKIRLGFID